MKQTYLFCIARIHKIAMHILLKQMCTLVIAIANHIHIASLDKQILAVSVQTLLTKHTQINTVRLMALTLYK